MKNLSETLIWRLRGVRHFVIIHPQLTPDSLLSSEQFVVGSGQSVWEYRQNACTGDNGIRFSIEDRIILVRDDDKPMFQLIPFFDLGYVWNPPNNDNIQDKFITSLGLVFQWEPIQGITVRFDYGYPFIDLDFVDKILQDDGIHLRFVLQPEKLK